MAARDDGWRQWLSDAIIGPSACLGARLTDAARYLRHRRDADVHAAPLTWRVAGGGGRPTCHGDCDLRRRTKSSHH